MTMARARSDTRRRDLNGCLPAGDPGVDSPIGGSLPPPQSMNAGSIRSVAIASLIGTTIEWYDFYLYGTAAALVFNQLFFPTLDRFAGTMASFATYAVGFFARPLGAIIFGHYGDKIGRRSML